MKPIRIEVRNTMNGDKALMEVTADTRLQEILDNSVELWSLPTEPFLMRAGRRLLSASKTVEESSLEDGDAIDILPDPEGG